MVYIFAKQLKTLRGLTPYEYNCKVWTTQPNRFILNPLHHTLGTEHLNCYKPRCFATLRILLKVPKDCVKIPLDMVGKAVAPGVSPAPT